MPCMTQSEEDRHRPLWWAGGLSDVSEGCRNRLLLLASGYQNAPEPTHNCTHQHTHTHTVHLPAGTHKPLCCELDSTIGASVGQAYYSSPEGVVSLLTGRHKYSSTSSPRVNGCPSGSNETYRTARAWCTHTHTHSTGTFIGIARSLMEMGKTREDKRPHEAGMNTLFQYVYMGTDK